MNKNISKLRFPEFNDEWKEKYFYENFDIIDGDRGENYPNTSDFYNDEYCLFLNAKNVTKDGFIFNETMFITKEKNELLRSGKLERKDIVLTSRGTLGNVGVYTENIKFENIRINSGMLILRTKISNENFNYQYLMSPQFKKVIQQKSFGSAQPQLTKSDVSKFKIKLPNLQEQQKIADFLSTIDSRIETQKEKIENIEDLKKGVMQKIFSQEIRFKDENGKEYPEWKEKNLGEVTNIKKGTQLKKDEIIEEGKYYHLNGGINSSNLTNKWNTEANTISISEGGNSCGYVNWNKCRFFSGGHNYTLETDEVNNYYLFQFLKYNQEYIMRLRVGSGLPNIQLKDLAVFNVKIPYLKEQQKIANFLSLFDEKIETEKKILEVLQEIKKGLLQQMFV